MEEARVCLNQAQEILSKPEDWKGLAAGVALSEALLASAEEGLQEAETAFQRAAEINDKYGLVYERGRALYQWGVMRLDRAARGASTASGRAEAGEDRQRGLDLLDQSLALFQRCDAMKDIERVASLLEQIRG